MIPTRNPKKTIRTFVSYPIDDVTSDEFVSTHETITHKKSSDNQYTYDIKTTDSKADDDFNSIFDRFYNITVVQANRLLITLTT